VVTVRSRVPLAGLAEPQRGTCLLVLHQTALPLHLRAITWLSRWVLSRHSPRHPTSHNIASSYRLYVPLTRRYR